MGDTAMPGGISRAILFGNLPPVKAVILPCRSKKAVALPPYAVVQQLYFTPL